MELHDAVLSGSIKDVKNVKLSIGLSDCRILQKGLHNMVEMLLKAHVNTVLLSKVHTQHSHSGGGNHLSSHCTYLLCV